MGSKNFEELWMNIDRVLEMLEFDYAAFYVNGSEKGSRVKGHPDGVTDENRLNRRRISHQKASVSKREEAPAWDWTRGMFEKGDSNPGRSLLRLELPLLMGDNIYFGNLVLIKDVKKNGLSHYTLRRVEHLRRTVIRTLDKLENKENR